MASYGFSITDGLDTLTPPETPYELTHLRTANSKTFDLGGNGQYRADHSITPMHWLDEDGVWQEIDHNLDATGSPNSTHYAISIASGGIGYIDKLSGESVVVSLTAIGDTPSSQFTITAPAISGNTATWVDVVPDVDIYLEALPSSARFHAVIKSSSAPTSFTVQYTQPAALTTIVVDTTANGTDATGLDCQVTETESSPTTDASGNTVTSITYTFTGNVKVRDPNTRLLSWQPTPTYPVDIDPTVTSNITADADDCTSTTIENSNFTATNNYDYFGYSTYNTGHKNAGFRFALNVPKSATVSSATLTVYIAKKQGYAKGTFYGSAVASSTAWSSSYRPENITKTAHSTAVKWTATGSQTADVTNIVQDVVNGASWAANNHISLAGLGINATGSANYAYIWDIHRGSGANVAQLSVTYSSGSYPLIPSCTCNVFTFTPTGGVKIGGSAIVSTHPNRFYEVGKGGVLVGGTATVNVATQFGDNLEAWYPLQETEQGTTAEVKDVSTHNLNGTGGNGDPTCCPRAIASNFDG